MFRIISSKPTDIRSSSATVSPGRARTYFGRPGAFALLAALSFSAAIWATQRKPATTYVSTQSGSWNDSGTWGGAGVPNSSDDVVISSGHTVTLGATCFSRDLTISPGGVLDLNGQQFNFQTNGAGFTNNGTLTNTGGYHGFYFIGNGAPGGVTQSFGGAGAYGGNVALHLHSSVTVNVVASTSLTFASATNNTNLLVDAGSTLSFASPFNFTAPSSGSNYVGVLNNGIVSGGGLLRTQGNVEIVGGATIGSPVEIVSGAQQGSGSFGGDLTIDNGATFKLTNTLIPYGNLSILGGATLDLNARQVNFLGNGKTFTNNGALTNTGAVNTFYLHGNFTPGAVTQNVAGAGNYDSNVRLRLYAEVVVNVSSGTAFNGLLILSVDTGSTLNLPNPLTFTGPTSGPTFATITINGSISGNGGLNTQGQVQINCSGTFDTLLEVVNGTTQTAGSFVNAIAIDNTATLKVTGIIDHTANLTIQSGGTLDLNGQQINFRGNVANFTNNGLLTNTGLLNRFYFHGNGTPGAVTQGFGGAGTYSGNLTLRLYNQVTVNIAASTSVTFNSATNNNNLDIDAGSTLSLANALNFAAPAAGANYVGILNNGTISGGGGLKTQGNVQIFGAATIGAPVEIASGTAQAQGTFSGAFTIGSGASLNLLATLILTGDLTVQTSATLDLTAQQINFAGNGATLTNNGLLTNTGAGNNFYFHGAGVPGAITQTLQGTGAFTGNVQAQLFSSVSLTLGSDFQLAVLVVNPGSTMDITNHMLKLSGAGTPMIASGTLTTTGSTIVYNGTAPQTIATINVGYYSLMIDNPTGVTLSAAKTVPGTLTLANGVFTIGANLTMGNGALIRRSDGSLSAPPNFGASINAEYFGANPITTGTELPATATVLNNLTMNNSSTVTLGSARTVNGTLFLNSGTLSNGANLTMANGTTIQRDSGTLGAAPTFGTSANVSYVGTPGVTTGPEIPSSATVLSNLTINKSGGVSLGGNATVNGTLALSTGPLDVGSKILVINNGVSVTGGSLTSGVAGRVNYNQSSNGQNVLAGSYGDLLFSNFNKILPAATINIAGTFIPGSAVGHSVTGSTVNFNGAASQTIPPFNYDNLMSSNSGARTLQSSGTIHVASIFTPGGNSYTVTGSTVEYNGAIAQTLPTSFTPYNNLTINNTAGVNGSGVASLTVNGLLRVHAGTFTSASTYNIVQIDIGATLAATAGSTINVAGNWTNNGSFTASTGTINLNGSTGQVISGSSATVFNNLTIDNAAGVTLSSASAVNGALVLTAGAFTNGANLTMGTGATIKRDSGSLSAAPSLGAPVNVEYLGTVAVTTGPEMPGSATALGNLTDNKAGTVTLGSDATVNGALALNTGTLAVGANTLTINNGTSIATGTLTSGATGTVNYNQQSNGQNVLACDYGILTLSNFNKTFPPSGTVRIAGTFNAGTASGHTITGSTIEYNGSGSPQTLPSGFVTYNRLTVNNAAGTTGFAGLTVNELLRVQAGTFTSSSTYHNVQIDSGATLAAAAASTINVSGDWSNNGSFTANNGTVSFNGSAVQNIGGSSVTTFNNLTINNIAGVTLGGDVTVNGILLLTSGNVATNANTLMLGGAASSNRTSGHVIGNLKKSFTGAAAFIYAVGSADGYSPVNAAVTEGAGELTVRAVQGPQPNVEIPSRALQRYWTLAGAGVTVDLTFNYLDPEDTPPTANESAFHLFKYSGSFTDLGAAGLDAANNKYTTTGVSSFSDWTLAEVGAPTEITFAGFTATGVVDAKGRDAGTLLEWQTGMEVSNLGFYIHREEGGKLNRITTDLIAGSALFAGAGVVLTSGRSYSWCDPNPAGTDARYWLEEVDLAGASRMYGPFFAGDSKVTEESLTRRSDSALISDVGKLRDSELERTHAVEAVAQMPHLGEAQIQAKGFAPAAGNVASQTAVKLGVTHEGWYRVTQPQLVRAGLHPKVEPRLLQLFADGGEQPIKVTGEQDGSFDPDDAIEFYGVGIDSPYSATRAYWVAVGPQAGRRIAEVEGPEGKPAASGFPYTVERRDRTIYFSALRNGDRENFFGAVVSRGEVNQKLMVNRIVREPGMIADLEVALQGVTTGPHLVKVQVNGVELERVSFSGQQQGLKKISVPGSLLGEGQNVVTFAALAGEGDISLVDYLRLTYRRAYVADNDWLALTAWANEQVTIDGFSNEQIRAIDVTNANEPVELKAKIGKRGSSYNALVNVQGEGERRLLAFTAQRVEEVSAAGRQASNWKGYSQGADYVIITQRELVDSLKPLAALRESQGLSVAMIDVEDLYNEFNYGQKTPQAVRGFLALTQKGWKKSPRYVLFAGDASYDAKNYLGFGYFDLVPTKLIDTAYLETASDDWFADFNGDGAAEIAIGRLPFRTAIEAAVIVSKIIGYEKTSSSQRALLVADSNDGFDFEKATDQLREHLPANVKAQQIYRGRLDSAAAKSQLLEAIARGQKIVNYTGHGSTNQWRGSLLTGDDARALMNGDRLPLFVMMTCLNGYFQDPATDSLGESLIKAEHGGAIAVWASTGLTIPDGQAVINQQLFSLIFERRIKGQPLTLGEAAVAAKSAVSDNDVRRTWILLGDPTTRLK